MATVLIIGATSEMAIAIANEFAKHQFDVQLAARNVDQLTTLQSDLQIRYSIKCTLHMIDILEVNNHTSFFEELPIKPNITVCVVGYLGNDLKGRSDWKEAHTILNTNYVAPVSLLNIISNYYESQKNGTIVGISSVAGERGRQSNYLYGSAKAGFSTYLSGLRNRLYAHQVHVLSVQPGFVYTKMTENLNLPKLLTAQPSEVGKAVYLAVQNKKNTIYVRWFWKWIMLIIKCIPEFIFKKLKL